jgi:hypothetical protein
MGWRRMNVMVDFTGGTTIDEAITEAIEFSRKNDCFVKFDFNGIPMNVCALSDHREADVEVYRKMYYSMLESRERKQKERNTTWPVGKNNG